jgi:hypothetical protein
LFCDRSFLHMEKVDIIPKEKGSEVWQLPKRRWDINLP